MKTPKVSDTDLLNAFEHLCKVAGKQSRGFDVTAIDGEDQWAMKNTPKYGGWMAVCGLGGCGVAVGRFNARLPTRWSFLMMLEAYAQGCRDTKWAMRHPTMTTP